MNKKIVIFDLDGTLLNTLYDLTYSTNFALQYFNYPKKSIEQVQNYVGNGVNKLIERAIPNGKNNPDFDECVKIFKQNYKKNMYNNIKIYDGILELLNKLKNNNIKTAVASNKFDFAVKELCTKIFGNLIDYSAGENESAGILKKPAPDMVLNVLKHFKLNPEDALYIGDSEVDIRTAENCGIKCLSVTWGFKSVEFLKQHNAKILINSPQEIIKYL